jgi:hypothetical protein
MEEYIIIFLIIGWFATSGVKTQLIRILDVLLYGPFLIWLGYRENKKWIKLFLYFMGSTTVTYNLKNFIEQSS